MEEMIKRYRTTKAKPGQLLVKFGQEYGNKDLYFCHGSDGATKADGKMLMLAFESVDVGFGKSLRQELIDRGYDITTLKFTITKKLISENLGAR